MRYCYFIATRMSQSLVIEAWMLNHQRPHLELQHAIRVCLCNALMQMLSDLPSMVNIKRVPRYIFPGLLPFSSGLINYVPKSRQNVIISTGDFMTEIRQLCMQMIEILEKLYQQGKITKEEFEEHTLVKKRFIAGTEGDAL